MPFPHSESLTFLLSKCVFTNMASKLRLKLHQLSWITPVRPTANVGLSFQTFMVSKSEDGHALENVFGLINNQILTLTATKL